MLYAKPQSACPSFRTGHPSTLGASASLDVLFTLELRSVSGHPFSSVTEISLRLFKSSQSTAEIASRKRERLAFVPPH